MPETYLKKFEIRWSDIDANLHLANTAYSTFMVHTRMSFLMDNGIGYEAFKSAQIGPVILNENIHYIREILPSDIAQVDVQLGGLSEDRRFIIFHHHVYNGSGKLAAFGEILLAWISMESRKMVTPPETWNFVLDKLKKSDGYKIIHPGDTRQAHVPYSKELK